MTDLRLDDYQKTVIGIGAFFLALNVAVFSVLITLMIVIPEPLSEPLLTCQPMENVTDA